MSRREFLQSLGAFALIGFEQTNELIRTNANYHDIIKAIPEGRRLATLADEFSLELKSGLTLVDFYKPLFKEKLWVTTATGLRIPKGPFDDKIDSKGILYRWRTVLIGNEEVDRVLIPEGDRGGVVKEFNKYGLPVRIEYSRGFEPYKVFWLNPNPEPDPLTKEQDVAIRLFARDNYNCIHIDATYERAVAFGSGAYRTIKL